MGKVLTFYSYKGGVGRSMALANVAVLLAQWGYKVLVVDWDFEAPGIEVFYRQFLTQTLQRNGILDLLIDSTSSTGSVSLAWDWQDAVYTIEIPDSQQPLHLITAGQQNEDYFKNARALDIGDFYAREGGILIETLRDQWKKKYDFILIDSRTGMTDIGGICTIQLPDILVLLFSGSEQSLRGVVRVFESVRETRKQLPFDRFSLLTFPIMSRIDSTEEFQQYQVWLERCARDLKGLFSNWMPASETPLRLLETTKLPHIPYFSFGEKLAVLERGMDDRSGLGYAYESITALIAQGLEEPLRFLDEREHYVQSAMKSQPTYPLNLVYERQPRLDFYISYHRNDRHWAEWIAWVLEEMGFAVVIQIWDFRPGSNFVVDMQKAIASTDRTIVLISPDYLSSIDGTAAEWHATLFQDPEDAVRRFIPIRIRETEMSDLLSSVVDIDLVNLSEDAARMAIMDAVRQRTKPASVPFPGSQQTLTIPHFPYQAGL